jgi:hypothetical protein
MNYIYNQRKRYIFKKILRFISKFSFIIAIIASMSTLLALKNYARQQNRILNQLDKTIMQEQENVNILKVELAYISRPSNVNKLQQNSLIRLQPIDANRVITIKID